MKVLIVDDEPTVLFSLECVMKKDVKQSSEYQHCKVIFLSARSKEMNSQKGLDLGADLYLPKPFLTRELVVKAHELMQN